jgi:hypothetical protein
MHRLMPMMVLRAMDATRRVMMRVLLMQFVSGVLQMRMPDVPLRLTWDPSGLCGASTLLDPSDVAMLLRPRIVVHPATRRRLLPNLGRMWFTSMIIMFTH